MGRRSYNDAIADRYKPLSPILEDAIDYFSVSHIAHNHSISQFIENSIILNLFSLGGVLVSL